MLSLPDKANKDGWDDEAFFASKLKKINDSTELKKLGIKFSKIVTYPTSKINTKDTKLDNLAISTIQDYMIEAEKRMVSELVKNKGSVTTNG